MRNKKRFIESAKTSLIALLVCSAVFLIYRSGYYSSLLDRLGSASSAPHEQTGPSSELAVSGARSVKPLRIVVSAADGTRFGCAYSSEQLSAVFDSFSAALGEAIGSASTPEPVSEADFRACLSGCSVTFDFYYLQPLSLLSSWLGTGAGGASEYSARYLSVSCQSDSAALFFRSGSTFYRCKTEVSSASFLSRMENYRQNNCIFAFESEKYDSIAPYTVILDSLPAISAVSSSPFIGGLDLDSLFVLLDMNAYVIKPYSEPDGTRVYVGSGKTLRVCPDGSLSYKTGADGQSCTRTEAIDTAAAFAYQCLNGGCGAAELYFSGCTEADGTFTICFDYCVNGIPVRLPNERHAAELTLSGRTITRAELTPRSYELGSSSLGLLPMAHACAIITEEGGGEPVLLYDDVGGEIECRWERG